MVPSAVTIPQFWLWYHTQFSITILDNRTILETGTILVQYPTDQLALYEHILAGYHFFLSNFYFYLTFFFTLCFSLLLDNWGCNNTLNIMILWLKKKKKINTVPDCDNTYNDITWLIILFYFLNFISQKDSCWRKREFNTSRNVHIRCII